MKPPTSRSVWQSARLRLTLSYAVFLVAAGIAVLLGVYIVLRFVPNYPLTYANPSDAGQEVASRGQILDALVGTSGLILVVLALIGLVGGWMLAGYILRPLARLTEASRIAATGDLDHRIHLAGRNDEFRELADGFDHMLDRLRDAFEAQERFAANASHELRTPLAITATLLDVAQSDPDGQNYPQLLERLRLTNDRAIGLTEALLRLADTNTLTAASTRLDLAEIVAAVTNEAEVDARTARITLSTTLHPAELTGDAALLTQLVVNLTQNALRHNVANGTAHITTGRDQSTGGAFLVIENTGRVYTADEAKRLPEPFLRGRGRTAASPASAGTPDGYGLGLSIVSRIVHLHGATLRIEPLQPGGLRVTVAFPRPTDPEICAPLPIPSPS